MKQKFAIIGACAMSICLGLALVACSPQESSKASSNKAADSVSADSLVAYHEGLGQDFSEVTEVSVQTCAEERGCHGGSWDSIVEKTDAMWKGVGQISDANPHKSHGTSGFTCDNCHSLTETSVNQCNGCHNFDTPSTWVDKDPATTTYGTASEEPLY